MSDFWIFSSFHKYERVLNVHWGVIIQEPSIFQDSKYAMFLHKQALHKVLNMPKYGWIIPHGMVLNMPCQRFKEF